MARLDPIEALAAELGAPVAEAFGRKVAPMLCAQDEGGGSILASRDHVFELKLDGVRIVAERRGAEVTLAYRRTRDATRSYPEVARAVAALGGPPVVLDGEIVAFDEDGLPDFQRLGRRIHVDAASSGRVAVDVPVAYLVFDVLAIGARDVRGLPLEARRALLERLVTEERGAVRLPPVFDDGVALFRMCLERGLEGVVAKRRGSTYREGARTTDWVKVKNVVERDFVVVGWTPGEGRRARFGALDLAAWHEGELVACGSVGSGLGEDTIDVLLAKLAPLEVAAPTARGRRTPARGRRHVRPELVVSVRFMGVSDEGKLRAPVFRGLREDVPASDCVLGLDAAPGESATDPCAEASSRWAEVRLVGLRVEGPKGAPGVVAAAATALCDLAREIGVPAAPLAAVPGALDVVLSVGEAPEAAAQAVAALLARLVSADRARVRVLVAAPRPFASSDPVRVALPLGGDELGPAAARGVPRAEAGARLERAEELARALLEPPADGLASAARALEDVVARWARTTPPR